jgi:hypothetical protein
VLCLDGVVLDLDVDVVVDVGLHGVGGDEPDGEALPIPRRDGGLVLDLARRGDVVDNPIVVIVLTDGTDDFVRAHALLLPPSEVRDAHLFAEHVHLHVKTEGRRFDAIAGQELAQIFMIHFWTPLGLAEGEAIVFHRQERFLGRHFVHLELDAGGGDRSLLQLVDFEDVGKMADAGDGERMAMR